MSGWTLGHRGAGSPPPYDRAPRGWKHGFAVQGFIDDPQRLQVAEHVIQSGARELQPAWDRWFRHMERAGVHVDFYLGDYVLTLPDTFPLVLCEH